MLENIKLILFDFDDTLCIHHKRGYTEKDEFELDLRIYKGKEPWVNHSTNKHMKLFLEECEHKNIKLGLLSVVSNFKHAQAKEKWILENYNIKLENFCVGTDEEKIRQLEIIAKAYELKKEEILIVDDKQSILNEVSLLGFLAWSPMEVVNYIEEK